MCPTVLYHRTTREAADAILREGFRDGVSTYMTAHEYSGVWLSHPPLDAGDGIPTDWVVLLSVTFSREDANAIAEFEWVEKERKSSSREWLVPAALINGRAAVAIAEIDAWGDPFGGLGEPHR